MREFETGATRDDNTNKHDYKGFLSARAIQRFGKYMHQHRKQADGTMRGSDNWKAGIPLGAYEESFVRHAIDFMRLLEDGNRSSVEAEELACALWFNVQGWLHETLKNRADQRGAINKPASGGTSAASFVVEGELRHSDHRTWNGLGDQHVLPRSENLQGSESTPSPSGQAPRRVFRS